MLYLSALKTLRVEALSKSTTFTVYLYYVYTQKLTETHQRGRLSHLGVEIGHENHRPAAWRHLVRTYTGLLVQRWAWRHERGSTTHTAWAHERHLTCSSVIAELRMKWHAAASTRSSACNVYQQAHPKHCQAPKVHKNAHSIKQTYPLV